MRLSPYVALVCFCAPSPYAQTKERPGVPPRATAAEYQAHAQAGDVTIAAELDGHSFLTPEGGPYESEDYIVIEAGVFGPSAKAVSYADFSLRINGKKNVVASRPFEFVAKSLKDPQWVPPDAGPESKSKTGISSGGQGDASKPSPPKMPFDLRHAMEQRAEKAWFPEGTRALPQAGLLFFPYRGKTENIRSLELLYEGAAGKATINLQP